MATTVSLVLLVMNQEVLVKSAMAVFPVQLIHIKKMMGMDHVNHAKLGKTQMEQLQVLFVVSRWSVVGQRKVA